MSVATASLIMAAIFALCGLLSIAAALRDWDWFFKSQALTGRLSRRRQRIIYGALGAIMIAMSTRLVTDAL